MISFTIKLLLAFSINPKAKKKPDKVAIKNPDKVAKKNPDKVAKNEKKSKHTEKDVEDPPYLIRLEKTCSSVHIEYEILPGKLKLYQIDVLCWPNAAKIYTADSNKLFKTITKNGLTFVPICIQHFLKELTVDELMILRKNVIEFNFFTDKNKLGNAAKSNKTELIYTRTIDVDYKGFVDAFAENVNKSGSMKKSDDGSLSHISTSSKFEAYSRMKFEKDYAEELYPIVDYLCNGNVMYFQDFIRACDAQETVQKKPETVPKKPTKDTKKHTKSEKVPGKLTLQMQGEIFFTDNNATFKLENYKSELSKIFVLPRVENLLTRRQKIYLNPIVINLESIENFPEEVFQNTGFTDIYCKYTIPCIGECKTIEKPLGKTIRFMESHFFPTHDVPKIKLIEFLGSRLLIVRIYGIKTYQQMENFPKMFGEKQEDFQISKIHAGFRKHCLEAEESLKSKNVLLAQCHFDLSSLMKNVWDYRSAAQLTVNTRIEAIDLQKNLNNDDPFCEFWSHYGFSLNHINLRGISYTGTEKSPLKQWLLLQNNTYLNLEAYILSPQSAALDLHQIPDTYKRLFLIAFRKSLAVHILSCILKHNQKIICRKLKCNDMVTGFVLDNGNNFAIYVEGSSIGYILNLLQELDQVTAEEAKIFFNTDQAYENRLYAICNKWSGLYIVNLKIPLQDILRNPKVYVKGNMPLLCRACLIKLDLLFKTSSLKKMFQRELFPTLEELVCLDVEYGVPYRWKSYQMFGEDMPDHKIMFSND